jgi:hypothetical protein
MHQEDPDRYDMPDYIGLPAGLSMLFLVIMMGVLGVVLSILVNRP